MFEQVSKAFDSTVGSIKGAFTTKPFMPSAYQANPSIIVDALEASFNDMFGAAPSMDRLKTITPRQAYAGGENVFVYGARRAKIEVMEFATDFYTELDRATRFFAIRSAMIIWSLPETVADELRRVSMGFAVPLTQAYYTTKHLNFNAGKFAASVTAQLHGTKIALKKRNRRFHARITNGAIKFIHLKQVVLGSGNVLTAQLDSRGTVTLFWSTGDHNEVDIRWEDSFQAVKLADGKWSEDEFNAVFVKLVAQHAPSFTEELAQAALGAKPLTRSSVVKEFAIKDKAEKKGVKEAAKAAKADNKAEKKEATDGAPVAATDTAEVKPQEAAPASQFTAEEQELVDKMAKDCPNFVARLEISEVGVRTVKFDIREEAAEAQAKPAVEVVEVPEEVVQRFAEAAINPDRQSTEEVQSSAELDESVIAMGELTGVPARQVKPCRDTNAIRIVGRVISKRAKHLANGEQLPKYNAISYVDETKILYVTSAKFSYWILCDVQGTSKSTFTLYADDLQALGEAIGHDFGKFQKEYFITSNVLMTKLLGNGSNLNPVVFDISAA